MTEYLEEANSKEITSFKHYITFGSDSIDYCQHLLYLRQTNRRRVEQLAARRAHNPEVTGSSPVPAIDY